MPIILVNPILLLIILFNLSLLLIALALEISGIKTIANDISNVAGNIIIGNTIPITPPNTLMASLSDIPNFISDSGINII